jgi:hypothetical protein
VITELRLRSLEKLLLRVCPLHGTALKVTLTSDRAAEITCQYEGYARILNGLLSKKENVAKLKELGYEKVLIRLGDRPKPIAIAEVYDFPPR